jgi:hypothetical protein
MNNFLQSISHLKSNAEGDLFFIATDSSLNHLGLTHFLWVAVVLLLNLNIN